MVKFCPECANPITDHNMPFCPKCGAKLPISSPEMQHPVVESRAAQQSQDPTTESTKKKRSTGDWIAICCGAAIIFVITMAILMGTMGGSSSSRAGSSQGVSCGPKGYSCINPSAVCCGGQYCCMHSCCGDNCCGNGTVCSNGQCCPTAYPYYYDGNCHTQPSSAGKCPINYYYENGYCYISCEAGKHCAGIGDTCCGTNCCKPGYVCSAGSNCCPEAYPYYMSDGKCHSSSSTSSSYYWYSYSY